MTSNHSNSCLACVLFLLWSHPATAGTQAIASPDERQEFLSSAATLPATLPDAIYRAWSSREDIKRADLAIQSAELTLRAKRAALYLPRVDLGMQAGKQRTPTYGYEEALPADITATVNGQTLDRNTLLSIARRFQAAPQGLVVYKGGAPLSLDSLIALVASSSTRESNTPWTYAEGYQQSMSLSVGYNLYSGGSEQRAVESAALQHRSSLFEAVSARRKVAIEVIDTWFSLRSAWLQQRHDLHALGLERRRLEARALQYAKGAISSGDNQRAQLDFEMQRLKSDKSAMHLEERRQALCLMLRMTPCPAGGPWEEESVIALPPPVLGIVTQWRTLSAERAETAREGQRLAVKEAKSSYLPRVSISMSSGWSGFSNISLSDARDQFKYRGWQLGIGLSWNLFDGKQTSLSVDVAKLKEIDGDYDIAQQLSGLRQQRMQNLQLQQTAILAGREARISLDLARLALDAARAKHRLGQGSDAELATAELAHASAMLAMQQRELEQQRLECLAALSFEDDAHKKEP